MEVSIRRDGDLTILCLAGKILGGHESYELRRELDRILERGDRRLLVDLRDVPSVKLFGMLDRVGIAWSRGLPLAALFVAAGWLTVRRLRRVLHRLRNANDEGSSEGL